MNFLEFIEEFSSEIGGQFSEYDQNKSVIVIPVDESRYQTVLGMMRMNEKYGKTGVEFTSKVCEFTPDIDLKRLLVENARFCHAKFVISDNFVKVEAATFLDNITDDLLKEMITEVAELADEYEFKLTGLDVH
ncbi:type III secretion system chaperone family protein [Marinigracilibium pacificum]|uniref:YbjN domain-containing protein n=1 Tax=Marinigracilibium pacificum TaxID=2729599 RepID=A0A848J7R1_9BACT|nr:hypothetical protein [Marinigracilibium pacificum]NMM50530.1 YbjN domain-containing protein [Marinigracilibium pacificum]